METLDLSGASSSFAVVRVAPARTHARTHARMHAPSHARTHALPLPSLPSPPHHPPVPPLQATSTSSLPLKSRRAGLHPGGSACSSTRAGPLRAACGLPQASRRTYCGASSASLRPGPHLDSSGSKEGGMQMGGKGEGVKV